MSREPVSQASGITLSMSGTKEQEPVESIPQQPEIVVETEDFDDLNTQSSIPIKPELCDGQGSHLNFPKVEGDEMSDAHIAKTRKARQTNPMACNVCSKLFHSKKCLRMHQVVHQSERPFSCDSCRWRFKLKSHLNEHKRLHTGDYRYKCPKCGKGFSRSNLVKLHLKSAHST